MGVKIVLNVVIAPNVWENYEQNTRRRNMVMVHSDEIRGHSAQFWWLLLHFEVISRIEIRKEMIPKFRESLEDAESAAKLKSFIFRFNSHALSPENQNRI